MNRKSSIIAIVKIAVVILLSLFIYWKDLYILTNEAVTNELATHIIIVPFLIAFILYRRRSLLRVVSIEQSNKSIFLNEVLGLLVCTIALVIYLTGSHKFYALEYHLFSMPLFIAGTILLIFNKKTLKTLFLPLEFLLLLIPPPTKLAYNIGNKLAVFSSEISYFFLKGMGLPITIRYYDETPILLLNTPQDQSIPLVIDIGCSGIYSLVAFTAFALFIVYLIKKEGARQKTILFFIGYPIMYGLNVFRIIIISIIGYWFGQDIALGFFHLFGGPVLVFLGTLILLLISEKILKIKIFRTKENLSLCSYHEGVVLKENFCPVCGELIRYQELKISKVDLSKIAALTIFVVLIISIEVSIFVMTDGLPEIITQIPLQGENINTQFLPTLPDYKTKFLYRDVEYEKRIKLDAALIYVYIPEDSSKSFILVDINIADERGRLHPWEQCVNPDITFDLRDVKLKDSPPVIGRFWAFKRTRAREFAEVILYWIDDIIFQTASGFEKKYLLTSIIVYTRNINDYQEIENLILPIGKSLVNFWQPIKDQSGFAKNINQFILLFINYDKVIIASLTLAIVLIIAIHLYRTILIKRHNIKSYNKLILEEKRILRAVHQADKKGLPTGKAIALEYYEIAGKPIETDYLLRKLGEAERAGLIKREIWNIDEKPILGWKSQFSLPK